MNKKHPLREQTSLAHKSTTIFNGAGRPVKLGRASLINPVDL